VGLNNIHEHLCRQPPWDAVLEGLASLSSQ
jgi:hypothetical protein